MIYVYKCWVYSVTPIDHPLNLLRTPVGVSRGRLHGCFLEKLRYYSVCVCVYAPCLNELSIIARTCPHHSVLHARAMCACIHRVVLHAGVACAIIVYPDLDSVDHVVVNR